jgi:hypothetical protein
MPQIKGTFIEAEAYSFMDIVALNGSSFIARADNPGPCPGDGWQLIASAGKPGKPGIKGDRGERGFVGERGPISPGIVSGEINPKTYVLKLIASDGAEIIIPCRGLFEQYDRERNG